MALAKEKLSDFDTFAHGEVLHLQADFRQYDLKEMGIVPEVRVVVSQLREVEDLARKTRSLLEDLKQNPESRGFVR